MIGEERRMAGPWRIGYDGAYYHVLSWGNEGRDLLVFFPWERGARANPSLGTAGSGLAELSPNNVSFHKFSSFEGPLLLRSPIL